MVTKRKYPRISTDDWPACCPPCTRKANEKTFMVLIRCIPFTTRHCGRFEKTFVLRDGIIHTFDRGTKISKAVFYRKLKFRDVERPPSATGHRSCQKVSLPGPSSTTYNNRRQFTSGDENRTGAAGKKTGSMEFRFRQRHTGG